MLLRSGFLCFFPEPWDDARIVENFGHFEDPTLALAA